MGVGEAALSWLCERCLPLEAQLTHTPYSDEKVANRNGRDFGWEIAHAAVSRRPPIFLAKIVPRIEGYTYNASIWALSIVQGPFSAPCQTLTLRFATFPTAVRLTDATHSHHARRCPTCRATWRR